MTPITRLVQRRTFSSSLDAWINQPKSISLTDTLSPSHLADLYITLPTRDGSRTGHPYNPPARGLPLEYGHHLAFFHPRHPEHALCPDGTNADFAPPPPFTRRMWASGKIRWNNSPGAALKVGDDAVAAWTIDSVEKKVSNTLPDPIVFVNQRIHITPHGREEPSVVEERSYVHFAARANKRTPREVAGLPRPDFSFTYKPSLTTLFRFSALTFNAHRIHLDKDYAQHSEGHPECLVHGPLSALMLIEVLQFYKPGLHLHTFEYRARNPVIVNRNSTIHGALTGENKAEMWCEDDDGVVGMTGSIAFSQ